MITSAASARPVAPLLEHFFRHEAGRLAAVLTRFFGWRHFDLVEETVQATLLEALQSWRVRGVPENASGWIHRVAKNRIIDALRRVEIRSRVIREWATTRPTHSSPTIDELFVDTEIEDSQLRLMFACCHPLLAREDHLALTLKALCGFGNSEIARALLITDEAAKKRLQRAKERLIEQKITLEPPPADELTHRLDSVHQALYLLFNEGYSSSHGEAPIRADLCEEAARLCFLLCSHRHCSLPSTFALMALMLFHAARLAARIDHHGSVLLMEDQDRSKWDRKMIRRAHEFLDQSAEGTTVSPYHLEAGIAFLHCKAPSYAKTDWQAILRLYDALLTLHGSPVYVLNRAIVLAQFSGPEAGIRALTESSIVESLRHYHLYDATLGELYRRAGDMGLARQYLESAKRKTHSPSDHEILDRRLAKC
ncbi:MAG: sigma-70 family RNA polymerase sigma factor [Planctomycetes bacterium]|nr:sigma-70 family RNA polymerase sigma factor [Planctomycetota bacterium]